MIAFKLFEFFIFSVNLCHYFFIPFYDFRREGKETITKKCECTSN